jgi:hypothetical protein
MRAADNERGEPAAGLASISRARALAAWRAKASSSFSVAPAATGPSVIQIIVWSGRFTASLDRWFTRPVHSDEGLVLRSRPPMSSIAGDGRPQSVTSLKSRWTWEPQPRTSALLLFAREEIDA